MARKPDTSAYKTFDQITDRLDEIIGQVRDKDTSLERSLDLFDEAIALGSKAVDLVDTTDFSPAELERLKDAPVQADEADGVNAAAAANTTEEA
ncbi:MAG: exodeoxyribonuclease VII small subunit [Coriobacteriaceae bacterium]|nr:exodeoxyribonuclease VII small subunit [Coriobacteriaceae bacterium]